MIGFAGFEFTSASGKKFHCTPMARASSAEMCPKDLGIFGFAGSSKGHGVGKDGCAIQAHGYAAFKVGRDQ